MRNDCMPEEIVYDKKDFKIKVPMASCTIAAGANEVLLSINTVVESMELAVEVTPVGCMGLDFIDPWIELSKKGYPSTIYGNVTPDIVEQIIREYLDRDYSGLESLTTQLFQRWTNLTFGKTRSDGYRANVE